MVVEDVAPSPYAIKFGVCLNGQGSCPPEDIGGTPGCRLLFAPVQPVLATVRMVSMRNESTVTVGRERTVVPLAS